LSGFAAIGDDYVQLIAPSALVRSFDSQGFGRIVLSVLDRNCGSAAAGDPHNVGLLAAIIEEMKDGVGEVTVAKKATIPALKFRRRSDQLGPTDRAHLRFSHKGCIGRTGSLDGAHATGYLLDVNAGM
jgi:hypothetical protein